MHRAAYKMLPCYSISAAEFGQGIILTVKGRLLIIFKSLLKVAKFNLLKILQSPLQTRDPQLLGFHRRVDLVITPCHNEGDSQSEKGTWGHLTHIGTHSLTEAQAPPLQEAQRGQGDTTLPSQHHGQISISPVGPQQLLHPDLSSER